MEHQGHFLLSLHIACVPKLEMPHMITALAVRVPNRLNRNAMGTTAWVEIC